jgi:hypothetical protein
MSGYNVKNNSHFRVQQCNTVLSALQDYVSPADTNTQIVYATFQYANGEFRIHPMNLNNSGFFNVTQAG